MGRSRGGLNTKLHALVNENGLPLRFHLTPGQAHDAPAAKVLLSNLRPGQQVLADKAYDADWIRTLIWEQGAQAVIPSKSNRKMPKTFDKAACRERNHVERFFGRIKKSFRRIATRYEKTARNFMALIKSHPSDYGVSFMSPLPNRDSPFY
jgi:transposase